MSLQEGGSMMGGCTSCPQRVCGQIWSWVWVSPRARSRFSMWRTKMQRGEVTVLQLWGAELSLCCSCVPSNSSAAGLSLFSGSLGLSPGSLWPQSPSWVSW